MKKLGIGCLVVLGLFVLVGLCVSALEEEESITDTSDSSTETQQPPPTPEVAFARLESLAATTKERRWVLQEAQSLIEQYPGTPESELASEMIPELEAAAEAEDEAAAARKLALKWSYSAKTDAMTDRISRTALILSENTISLDFPYEGAQHGTLVIRDHPSYGKNVLLTIEQGQFLCQSYRDCQIRVRFDDEEPRTWRAIGPRDNSTTTIFLRNYNSFVQRMRRAEIVRIQPELYQEGAPVFEFHVGGFDNERYRGSE